MSGCDLAIADRLCRRGHTEALADAPQVVFDRPLGEAEDRGDLDLSATGVSPGQHLAFAVRKRADVVMGGLSGIPISAPCLSGMKIAA